jgi:hypothetical protein
MKRSPVGEFFLDVSTMVHEARVKIMPRV